MSVHDCTGHLILDLGKLLHGSLDIIKVSQPNPMGDEEIKTLAAELATLGSTTLARKATVLMIGFPELDKQNIHT